eukprot:4703817-Prymnesium_polylepis.2
MHRAYVTSPANSASHRPYRQYPEARAVLARSSPRADRRRCGCELRRACEPARAPPHTDPHGHACTYWAPRCTGSCGNEAGVNAERRGSSTLPPQRTLCGTPSSSPPPPPPPGLRHPHSGERARASALSQGM